MCSLKIWLAALWRLQYRQMTEKAGTFQETVALIWERNHGWWREVDGDKWVRRLWLAHQLDVWAICDSQAPFPLHQHLFCSFWLQATFSVLSPASLDEYACLLLIIPKTGLLIFCLMPLTTSLSSPGMGLTSAPSPFKSERALNISLANSYFLLCHVS